MVVDVEAGCWASIWRLRSNVAASRSGTSVQHLVLDGRRVARRARGGQCSSRYGKIEDMVRSADCVLGTAERVTLTRRFGGPTRSS